jgi:hypothetical protein
MSVTWHNISIGWPVIRVTTRKEDSRTVVIIDGQLQSTDLAEVQRVRKSMPGKILLELNGLTGCADDGVRFLRDWLTNGAQLGHAATFLRMVLEQK